MRTHTHTVVGHYVVGNVNVSFPFIQSSANYGKVCYAVIPVCHMNGQNSVVIGGLWGSTLLEVYPGSKVSCYPPWDPLWEETNK